MLPSLYEHQHHFVDKLRKSLKLNRRVIACARTGFGKSRVAKWIAGSVADRDCSVLLAVHRRGLVDNLSQAFDEDPQLPHGIIMSLEETWGGRPVQIASIDTMLSWYCEGDYDGPIFDLIIFDEAHSHHSKFARFLKKHDDTKGEESFVIGLTATPEAKGLSDIYRSIVTGPTADWLERHGFAVPFRYMAGRKGRLEKLVKRGNKFTEASQDEAMKGLQGDFVRDWLKYGHDRPTVGFFPRLSHAEQARACLESQGVKSAYVDGTTSDDDRRKIFRDLENGEISYLCNVGVVERGTNIPAIASVQLCVAIGDRKRFLQMLGRGSRIAEGKTDCMVIDHGGNLHRHGLYTDETPWTLDQSQNKSSDQCVRAVIECPQCSAVYRGGRCRACGYEPTKKERRAQGLEFDGSKLVPFVRKTKPTTPRSCEDIMIDCLYMAARSGKTYRQACGMAKKEAERRGQVMVWPYKLRIGDRNVYMLRYGDPNQHRKVEDIFPWMSYSKSYS